MVLKLSFNVKDEPWYPQGRIFTEFEARIDLLLLQFNESDKINPHSLSIRWQWKEEDAARLMEETPFSIDHYAEEDSKSKQRARAQEVIDIFNAVFKKNITLTPSRMKTINARIKEGKSLKPHPVGNAQFKAVFEYKKEEWTGTEQEKYLTIDTLCAAKHFMKYLEAAREAHKAKAKRLEQKDEGIRLQGAQFKQ